MTLPTPGSSAPPPDVNTGCASCGGTWCDLLHRVAVSGHGTHATPALVEACWSAVFAVVRRSGLGAADAEDVTQAYFVRFLEKDSLRDLARWDGCFRPFLFTTVRHFLSNQRDFDRARKRGGGWRHVSLTAVADADRPMAEPRDLRTPESLLREDRSHSLAEQALRVLALEMPDGRSSRFDRVAPHLVGATPRGFYRDVAAEWAVSEPAVRIFVFRLRRRLRALLSGLAAAVTLFALSPFFAPFAA